MRKKIHDMDQPIGKLVRIKDFLPAPQELAAPEGTVKVTILLKKSSVETFKHLAHRHNTKYQRMIRELVDKYATKYS